MSREPLTNAEEAALLRALGDQIRGKSLFGFELTVLALATVAAPARRPGEEPIPLHALPCVQRLAVRYYIVIASDREAANKLVQILWRSVWGSWERSREISPEAALHRGAIVLLERPEGWVDDGTSADAENRFSRVEDRCLLAALLAAMAREER